VLDFDRGGRALLASLGAEGWLAEDEDFLKIMEGYRSQYVNFTIFLGAGDDS
jgi:hypothetical protein